jgi:hypothetical protein
LKVVVAAGTAATTTASQTTPIAPFPKNFSGKQLFLRLFTT